MENAGRRLSQAEMPAVISGNSSVGDLNFYYFY